MDSHLSPSRSPSAPLSANGETTNLQQRVKTPLPSPLSSSSVPNVSRGRKREADSEVPTIFKKGKEDQIAPATSIQAPQNTPTTVCCEETDLLYHVSNLKCAKDEENCRIVEGQAYAYFPRLKQNVCLNHVDEREKFESRKHQSGVYEEVLCCRSCQNKWHRCCSFHYGSPMSFVCKGCGGVDPLEINDFDRLPLDEITEKMEATVNKNVWEGSDSSDRSPIFLRRVSTERKRVLLKDQVCPTLYPDFEAKYGKSFDYVSRAIYAFQKVDGIPVMFFAMYAQEYESINEEKWVILDYMDTVPLCQPEHLKGKIYGNILNAYFECMGKMGFQKGHFWAKPARKGDGYVFCIHPAKQQYPTQDGLQKWYKKCLERGIEKNSIKGFKTFVEIYGLNDENEKKFGRSTSIQFPVDLPLFKDSLWMIMLDWSVWEAKQNVQKEESKKKKKSKIESKKEYEALVMKVLEDKYFKTHSHDNFFIDLLASSDVAEKEEETMKPHKVLGDRAKFLSKCGKNKWEWSNIRRAKFASVGVIKMALNEK